MLFQPLSVLIVTLIALETESVLHMFLLDVIAIMKELSTRVTTAVN
jgi:hypothetical protein